MCTLYCGRLFKHAPTNVLPLYDPSHAHLTITYPNECLVLCLVHNLFLFDVFVWAELSCCNSLMNRKVVCLSSACHMNMHMNISHEHPLLTSLMPLQMLQLRLMVLVYSFARVRRCIMTTRLSTVLPRPRWDAIIRDECMHMDYMLELKSIILLGQKIIFISRNTNYMLASETAYYIFACLPASNTDTRVNCDVSRWSGRGRWAGFVMSYCVTDVNEMHGKILRT